MKKTKKIVLLLIIVLIYALFPILIRLLLETFITPSISLDKPYSNIIYDIAFFMQCISFFISVIILLVGIKTIIKNMSISKGLWKFIKIFTISFFVILLVSNILKYSIIDDSIVIPKPVLYLYPKEKTDISVKVEKPELLMTTYPKYNDGWKVSVESNGDMYDNNNKYYYGLYWIERKITEEKFETGFYVEKEDAIDFLEEKLSFIGLNDRERNEFIMYWLPILEENEKSIINFDLTDEIENINKLIIEPKPDSLLRVHMNVKKVNNKVNIKEQQLKSFNRTGYSAIEWGGSIIK